jgi:hypothetical protein
VQVTDLWIGDPSDPPLATSADMTRALALVVSSGLLIAAVASAVLLRWNQLCRLGVFCEGGKRTLMADRARRH